MRNSDRIDADDAALNSSPPFGNICRASRGCPDDNIGNCGGDFKLASRPSGSSRFSAGEIKPLVIACPRCCAPPEAIEPQAR